MEKTKQEEIKTRGFRFLIEQDGKEVARAFLYLMSNDLHGKNKVYGYLEDVYVDESCRGQGLGTKIVSQVIKEAKNQGCYKMVATSRYGRDNVHRLYEKVGFEDFGKEFKIYF